MNTSFNSDTPSDRSSQESNKTELQTTSDKLRPASRISPLIGSRASNVFSRGENPSSDHNMQSPRVKAKPDCDRMVETLKVIMMMHDTFDTLPRQYNSYILHLLEAYQDLCSELAERQETIDSLQVNHQEDLKEFEMLAIQWETHEKDYRLEIKRLEVLLASCEGGMEGVAMARAKSLVHGTKHIATRVKDSVNTIRKRHESSSNDSLDTSSDQCKRTSLAEGRCLIVTLTECHYDNHLSLTSQIC